MIRSRPSHAAGWIFLLFLLENALRTAWAQSAPQVLLIGVAFFALRNGPVFGLGMGVLAGILMEASGTGKMGGFLLLGSLVGGACGILSSKLFADSLAIRFFLPVLIYVLQTAGQIFSWQSLAWTFLFSQGIFFITFRDARFS